MFVENDVFEILTDDEYKELHTTGKKFIVIPINKKPELKGGI